MKSMISALIVLVMTSIVLGTATVDRKQTLDAAVTQRSLSVAESGYTVDRDNYLDQIAAYMQACNASQTGSPPNPYQSTAPTACATFTNADITNAANSTVNVAGSTNRDANGNIATTSYNADGTLNEQRIALTITYSQPNMSAPIYHELVVRGVMYSPWYELLSDIPEGNASDIDVTNATDVGGCNTDGTGCNPTANATQDPTVSAATITCTAGYGSGVCPPTGAWDASSYNAPATWSNSQYTGP
jgi:hypothetical protein